MRAYIFTGGRLGEWALQDLTADKNDDDVLIGADKGALYLLDHGLPVHIAIGDFDSVMPQERQRIEAEAQSFVACDAVDKDWTDTELAFRRALSLGPEEIVLYGALGTRFDHSLANVHLLMEAMDQGIPCRIVDEYNEIRLIKRSLKLNRGRFPVVSLLPLTPEVTGIELVGFQYPLHNAVLRIGESLGISNVLAAESGTIRIRSGRLLVVQCSDDSATIGSKTETER